MKAAEPQSAAFEHLETMVRASRALLDHSLLAPQQLRQVLADRAEVYDFAGFDGLAGALASAVRLPLEGGPVINVVLVTPPDQPQLWVVSFAPGLPIAQRRAGAQQVASPDATGSTSPDAGNRTGPWEPSAPMQQVQGGLAHAVISALLQRAAECLQGLAAECQKAGLSAHANSLRAQRAALRGRHFAQAQDVPNTKPRPPRETARETSADAEMERAQLRAVAQLLDRIKRQPAPRKPPPI